MIMNMIKKSIKYFLLASVLIVVLSFILNKVKNPGIEILHNEITESVKYQENVIDSLYKFNPQKYQGLKIISNNITEEIDQILSKNNTDQIEELKESLRKLESIDKMISHRIGNYAEVLKRIDRTIENLSLKNISLNESLIRNLQRFLLENQIFMMNNAGEFKFAALKPLALKSKEEIKDSTKLMFYITAYDFYTTKCFVYNENKLEEIKRSKSEYSITIPSLVFYIQIKPKSKAILNI